MSKQPDREAMGWTRITHALLRYSREEPQDAPVMMLRIDVGYPLTLEQSRFLSDAELMGIRNFGRTSLRVLRERYPSRSGQSPIPVNDSPDLVSKFREEIRSAEDFAREWQDYKGWASECRERAIKLRLTLTWLNSQPSTDIDAELFAAGVIA